MDRSQIVKLVIFCIAPFVFIYATNGIFKRILRKKNNLSLFFFKNMLNAIVFLLCIAGIIDIFDTERVVSQRILMSSSVIAIVLGIVFQTGLTNLVHGIMLVIFKPFNVGDRVQVDVGAGISGYVKQITLRHVVIANIVDNADLIIPNSVVETCVVKNLSMGEKADNRYPLTINITYEQAKHKELRDLAKKIISDAVLSNGRTIDMREDKDEDMYVKVDYTDSAVSLTAFVYSHSAEDNFRACSEIKEVILDKFGENGIDFAHKHLEISGSLSMSQNGSDSESITI